MIKSTIYFLLLILLFSVEAVAQTDKRENFGNSVRIRSVQTNHENAPRIGCTFDIEVFNRSVKNKWFLLFRDKFEASHAITVFKKRSERQIDWLSLDTVTDLSDEDRTAYLINYTGDYTTLPGSEEQSNDSFDAVKLPPDGSFRFHYFGVVECNQIKSFIVLEADELTVNGKEDLEQWWDYPLLSVSGLGAGSDKTRLWLVNTIAWLRKPPSPRCKIAERIYSLEATNIKKHIVPLKINFDKKYFNKIQKNVQLSSKASAKRYGRKNRIEKTVQR